MKLIYAYIRKYRNFVEQEVCFDDEYTVSFSNGFLFIKESSQHEFHRQIRKNKQLESIHLVVGKTGSGKTNLLEFIGEQFKFRSFECEGESFFFLYEDEGVFFLEAANITINNFKNNKEIKGINRYSIKFKCFNNCDFSVLEYYGTNNIIDREERNHDTMIYHCFEDKTDLTSYSPMDTYLDEPYVGCSWIPRKRQSFSEVSLFYSCFFFQIYAKSIEEGELKQESTVSFFTHYYEDDYDGFKFENFFTAYWEKLLKNRKINRNLTNKQMFLHDFVLEYAKRLLVFIKKQLSWLKKVVSKDEFAKMNVQLMQIVGSKLVPSSYCRQLAKFIEYYDDLGMDWDGSVVENIEKVISFATFLKRFDEKFFSFDKVILPIKDFDITDDATVLALNSAFVSGYNADTLFGTLLIPYEFNKLSTGEIQYAKVFGTFLQCLNVNITLGREKFDHLIILMDEPDTYMHPELCRCFISRLFNLSDTFKHKCVQVIITTHSPFMLSDVFSSEITRLDIDKETGLAVVHNETEKNYYGANMFTILSDGFFLDYFIGESARKEIIDHYLNLKEISSKEYFSEDDLKEIRFYYKMIAEVGDDMLRTPFELLLSKCKGRI